MFYQLHWQQMEKIWKVICTASFYFIVTHYSTFCLLISVSLSLCHVRRIGMELQHISVHGGFSRYSKVRCVNHNCCKRAITVECSLSSAIQCKDLKSDPQASTTSIFIHLPAGQQSALRSLVVPYLSTSPQSQDKVLFSQLTSGWVVLDSPPPTHWLQKVILDVCHGGMLAVIPHAALQM